MRQKKCKLCGVKLKKWFDGLFDDRHGYPGRFEVLKCRKCGLGQTWPELKREEIAKVYAKYYPRSKFDATLVKREDYRMPDKEILRRKGLMTNCQYWVTPSSKVLDVGCGLGFSLLELSSIGCSAFGIDPDSNAEKLAKRFGLKFHRGFIEDKPFPRESFDWVLASQVLEHTNDPVAFVKTCASRLKPGGKLVMSFPNSESLGLRMLGKKWLHWHIPYHLNFFTNESVKILTEKTGLKLVMKKTETPNMWFNLQLRHLLINPKEGVRDEFWENGKPGLENKPNGWKVWAIYLLRKGFALMENRNPGLRFIDWLGWGDSFVVIWEKR